MTRRSKRNQHRQDNMPDVEQAQETAQEAVEALPVPDPSDIEYADESPEETAVREEAEKVAAMPHPRRQQRTSESIDAMRRKALEDRKRAFSQQRSAGIATPGDPLPAMDPETRARLEAELAPERFVITRDSPPLSLGRAASTYVLRAGKVVDSNNYDIDALRAAGVQLKPLEAGA